jgi:hypothetical protein
MKTYDYIILDIRHQSGLVSDALELAQYSDVTLYCKAKLLQKEMITLLNRVKRGELDNASIFNGFENKAKYGWLRLWVWSLFKWIY